MFCELEINIWDQINFSILRNLYPVGIIVAQSVPSLKSTSL